MTPDTALSAPLPFTTKAPSKSVLKQIRGTGYYETYDYDETSGCHHQRRFGLSTTEDNIPFILEYNHITSGLDPTRHSVVISMCDPDTAQRSGKTFVLTYSDEKQVSNQQFMFRNGKQIGGPLNDPADSRDALAWSQKYLDTLKDNKERILALIRMRLEDGPTTLKEKSAAHFLATAVKTKITPQSMSGMLLSFDPSTVEKENLVAALHTLGMQPAPVPMERINELFVDGQNALGIFSVAREIYQEEPLHYEKPTEANPMQDFLRGLQDMLPGWFPLSKKQPGLKR